MTKPRGYLIICLIVVSLLSSYSCDFLEQTSELNIETPTIIPPTIHQVTPIEEQIITHNGVERMYLLRIPLDVDPTEPAPVVFIFHGMGEGPRDMIKAGFNSVADQENFILVYPDIVSHSTTDFLEQILLDLENIMNVDPTRIYAMGFSLGGKLTYHAACDMSDTFAAFAAVSGMAICEETPISEKSVSILHIHGLGDDLVPYETGRYGMPPVDDTIAYWSQFNECAKSPQVEETGKITHTIYSPCRDGAVIELYTIEGLGHKVPTKEMSSARIIWEFFEAHPKSK